MAKSTEKVSRLEQEKIVKDAIISLIAAHRNEFEQLIREGKNDRS